MEEMERRGNNIDFIDAFNNEVIKKYKLSTRDLNKSLNVKKAIMYELKTKKV